MKPMEHALNGYGATTLYSLVSYIPGLIGSFLNDLRTELVSTCRLRSHVTILPPRVLSTPSSELVTNLRRRARDLKGFEIVLGDLAIFPVTNVIYIPIASGALDVVEMHGQLAQGTLAYAEPFPFHPHITAAQEIPPETVQDVYQLALRRWVEWPGPRNFNVDELVFVKNVNQTGWQTLSRHPLISPSLLRTG